MPNPPPTWYFPTEDPNWVLAYDYNPVTRRYDLNERRMPRADVPDHVTTAIDQSSRPISRG